MAPGPEPKSCSFRQIKAQLDPRCTYLVFEKAAEGGEAAFLEIDELLRPYREQVLARDLLHDRASARLFLVIKLDPRQARSMQSLLLHPKLPRGVVAYWYGNQPAAESVEPGRQVGTLNQK